MLAIAAFRTFLIVLLLVVARDGRAQQPVAVSLSRFEVGFHAAAHRREGEAWQHKNAKAFGGWFAVGSDRLRVDVDVSRGITLEESGEFNVCNVDFCGQSLGTAFERNWSIGVAALWPFRVGEHVSPHLLAGVGTMTRQVMTRWNDPSIRDYDRSWTRLGIIGGLGADFPLHGPVFARLQYRLDYAFGDMIHQARLSGGVRF